MQTSTRTGRFSCQKPNLQAFPNPKRQHSPLEDCSGGDGGGEVDTNVRALFTASRGGVLVGADYSQIEMRVLAHMCGDEAMAGLFQQAGDIYETLARIILDKKVSLACLAYPPHIADFVLLCSYYALCPRSWRR